MKTRQGIGIIITIILVGLCLTFSGCSSDSDSDTTPIETVLVQSGKERNTSPGGIRGRHVCSGRRKYRLCP